MTLDCPDDLPGNVGRQQRQRGPRFVWRGEAREHARTRTRHPCIRRRSPQCRERFVANPHLYIGVPGHKAPKQEGKAVMKQRRFRTEIALSVEGADLLRQELCAMMGVAAVTVDGNEVCITYDLLQATAAQIEARMAEVGVQMGEAWPERLRRAFVHYLEECEVDSLAVRPQPGQGIHGPG